MPAFSLFDARLYPELAKSVFLGTILARRVFDYMKSPERSDDTNAGRHTMSDLNLPEALPNTNADSPLLGFKDLLLSQGVSVLDILTQGGLPLLYQKFTSQLSESALSILVQNGVHMRDIVINGGPLELFNKMAAQGTLKMTAPEQT